jgi:hypothetical protein
MTVGHADEVWHLERIGDDVVLYDAKGVEEVRFPARAAVRRIQFPYLLGLFPLDIFIAGRNRRDLWFKCPPETKKAVKAFIKSCIGADPKGAVAHARAESIRDLVLGVLALVVGIGVTVASIAYGGAGGVYVVTTGLIAVGVVGVIKGYTGLIRAAALAVQVRGQEAQPNAAPAKPTEPGAPPGRSA